MIIHLFTDGTHGLKQPMMTITKFAFGLALALYVVIISTKWIQQSTTGSKTKHDEDQLAVTQSETVRGKKSLSKKDITRTLGTVTVLFHAHTTNGFQGSTNSTTTFMFTDIKVNEGGGFNAGRSIFKAPTPGLYFFSYNVLPVHITSNENPIVTSLVVNGKRVSSASSAWPNTASRSDLLLLGNQDEVYVECDMDDDPRFTAYDQYNSFRGYKTPEVRQRDK